MDESNDTPPLVAAPRHLHKRFFHEELADELLIPGLDPRPSEVSSHGTARQAGKGSARVQAYARKRAVALLVVIIVSISIPALVFALIIAG